MNGISIKAVAIAIATAVTFVLDTVIGIALVIIMGSDIPLSGMAPTEASEAIRVLTMTTPFLIASMVLGTLTTINGGYLTGRIAQQVPYLNALAFGIVAFILGIMFAEGLPWWYIILGLALTLPAALLGGYLAKIKGR